MPTPPTARHTLLTPRPAADLRQVRLGAMDNEDAGEVTRLRNSAAELHKQADTLRQQLVAQLVDDGVPIREHRHGGQCLVPASRADRPTGRTRREDGEPRGCPSLRDHHAHEDVPVATRVQHRYPQ